MNTVLIVDDSALMRNVIKKMLTESGYKVCGEAGNGYNATLQYKKLKPDIVTMDITMPILDGLLATQWILRDDPAARVIMTSAIGQQPFVI
jgi:two-component system chemotaxis response regulator CheY